MKDITRLDANQVIKNSYNETLKALKVVGEYDEIQTALIEALYDAIGTTADPSQTDPTQSATVVSLLKGILETQGGGAGPGGDASAANQVLMIDELEAINLKLLDQSTAVNQLSIIGELQDLNTKLLDQATAAKQDQQITQLQNINTVLIDIFDNVEKNIRTKILDAVDRVDTFEYADFGTKNQRITKIIYTSPTSYPGITIERTFNYSLVVNNYRRDSIVWSVS